MSGLGILSILEEDALANFFDVVIPSFPGVINLQQSNIRVTEIGIPNSSNGTYNVDYKAETMPKPNGKITTQKSFTFTFRIDKNYDVYKGFMAWRNLLLNEETGIGSPDFVNGTSPLRVPIKVVPSDNTGTVVTEGWTFTGCFPSEIGGFSYNVTTGDPLSCTVTMQFITMAFR